MVQTSPQLSVERPQELLLGGRERRLPVTSRDLVHHAVLWPICALELIFGVILLIYEFFIFGFILEFYNFVLKTHKTFPPN